MWWKSSEKEREDERRREKNPDTREARRKYGDINQYLRLLTCNL